MARVVLNKIGTDIQDLTVTQTSSSETTVILNDALLLGTKDYHFGVTELSVPLTNAPMFGWMKTDQELFQIQRRNTGIVFDETTQYGQTHAQLILFNAQTSANAVFPNTFANQLAYWTDLLALFPPLAFGNQAERNLVGALLIRQFTINPILADGSVSTFIAQPGRKFYDALQFTRALSMFCANFVNKVREERFVGAEHGQVENIEMNDDGDAWVVPEDADDRYNQDLFIRIQINADGRLLFAGTSFFWNNYMIRFSKTGAALIGVNFDNLTSSHLQFTNNQTDVSPVANVNHQLVVGNNNQDTISECEQSIFQTAECRLKVSVESHLPQNSNIEIRDTVQTSNQDICQGYFLNDVSVEMQWDANGEIAYTNYKNNIYAGQHSFINKNQPTTQWTKLISSINLAYFRFYLMIHYRVFNEETSRWGIVSERMSIPENEYWSCTIRFVSDE